MHISLLLSIIFLFFDWTLALANESLDLLAENRDHDRSLSIEDISVEVRSRDRERENRKRWRHREDRDSSSDSDDDDDDDGEDWRNKRCRGEDRDRDDWEDDRRVKRKGIVKVKIRTFCAFLDLEHFDLNVSTNEPLFGGKVIK